MLPVLMILLCVVGRVVPHPPNLAPQGAVAVFAGRTLPLWAALLLTLSAMFLGDVVLAVSRGDQILRGDTLYVYGAFAIQAVLGSALRNVRGGAIGAALLGSLVFFGLSNFGVWVGGGLYPHTAEGLKTTYVMALPYFRSTLLGDLCWTLILTGAYHLLTAKAAKAASGLAR